ncbi:hypothetical protein JTE90_025148 [Oedothorax gibbosus]|uniref:RNA helicase n=1 Tax=Oedothorax gibbosus TaxID=931172 RepID=A0AAV6UIY6_9ARAC|nr:hypothetical protein JTE90_025148 [Oedothorax gibbosus]
MGRSRKRFNEKGRTNGVQNSSNPEKVDIEVNLDTAKDKYDESNPLVLSAKKKKQARTPDKPESKKKKLTKKERKKLEQVLERKKKKINIQGTSRVQHSAYCIWMKRQVISFPCEECAAEELADNTTSKKRIKVSNIKGINKKQNQLSEQESESEESSSGSDLSEAEQEANASTPAETADEPIAEEVAATKKEETVEKVEVPKVEETVAKRDEIERIPSVFVALDRKPEIQATREALPIYCEEQRIVEAIKENMVVIIHGETGSGKTTQVPQFLYEAGFTQNGKTIGITEPRRIAAMTMAARVGNEMNAPQKVSYHIRYKKTVGKDTEIKFMTDGVLLKEMQHDFLLSRYSAVIIDEAHERSVNSDVLIGLLSRVIKKREKDKNPLKLIIMSATMRVEDFIDNTRLFQIQPVLISVDSRQHRVQIHFDIHTPEDYVSASYNKVCKIHRQLPPGAILVFLTGEKEVQNLCKILRQTFPFKAKPDPKKPDVDSEKDETGESPAVDKSRRKKKKLPQESDFCDMAFDLDNFAVEPLDTEDQQHQLSDTEDDCNLLGGLRSLNSSKEGDMPLHVLPLYAILPYEEQQKVFLPPPTGSRLCVVATNVAETSITIPGLKYVVDSGKVKTKEYKSKGGGISKFEIGWCSQASANQRAGRCGRTEGGHCYRLYSSAVFENDFPKYSKPEILRTPVDDVVLHLKALGIERVVGFPFPTPPDTDALKQAEKRLVSLGALQNVHKSQSYKEFEKWEYSAKVTPLGIEMSRLPLSPRYAKMLLLALKHGCVRHIVAIVSSLTVPDIFLRTSVSTTNDEGEEETQVVQEGFKKIGAGVGNSQLLGDVMVLLRTAALYEQSKNKGKFCVKYCIAKKSMEEIQKMSWQLIREMNRNFPDFAIPLDAEITPPDDKLVATIRKILAACLMDRVAKKIPREDTKDEKSLKNAYRCLDSEDPVFIHPASTMFQRLPEYVVYTDIIESSKLYMKGVVEIDAEWLPELALSSCDLSPPLEEPPPSYSSEKDKIYCCSGGTFGPWQWDLPIVRVEMPKGPLRYKWFCRFFLEGEICPTLAQYVPCLLSPPDTMLKSWASSIPKTRYLLQAVISQEVDSRESLRKVWKKDPKYLLREYWEWLRDDKHLEVELQWPPKL